MDKTNQKNSSEKEKEMGETKENETESERVDKTFYRLKELQDLLKKESALKELCKQRLYIL